MVDTTLFFKDETAGRENKQYFTPFFKSIALLVFKDNIRKPNSFAGDADYTNAIILRCIPGKAIINPLLLMTFERKVNCDIKN